MFGSSKNSRLGQWDGRKHSTRREEPWLKRLTQRDVFTKLLVVWLSTFAVTGLAIWWGPPNNFRLGQILPSDYKARLDFEVHQPAPFRPTSEPAPTPEKYAKGEILVLQGFPMQERHLTRLREEHAAFLQAMRPEIVLRRGLALFVIFSLLAASIALYVARFQTSLAHNLAMIAGVGVLIIATLLMGMMLDRSPWHAVVLPLTMTAMILTLAYNPQFALMISFSLVLMLAVVLGSSVEDVLVRMGGLATAILLLRHVRTRTQLVAVATISGVVFAGMTIASGLLTEQSWTFILNDALRRFLSSSLAGFLLTGLLPLVERCFGIVTDIRLLEYADGSHPLLQELVKRAPGTYTHSITVATLAETAAEAIGANPLLVRVGSYFHDIGKMLKPQYFIENQTGANRHDSLEPALSTLVIIGHVKDGLALAEEYRLPAPIVDFIAQHHGTTLVEYFYREAMRLRENSCDTSSTDLESCFRYPGPKPQTRENGLVMLADAVESTSRSLSQPTPASLSKLVHDILMKRLLDGQFEESGLTLTELHLIEESLSKSLIALFHARIKYPEAEAKVA
jgi:putative nucleotidyltransferase with HDIG domain